MASFIEFFDNDASYTRVNSEVASGKGIISLLNNPAQIFNEAFANSTGFTFNALTAEFVAGKVQHVDKILEFGDGNGTCAATFTSSSSLSWSKNGGFRLAALFNGAVASGGLMDLSANSGGSSYVTYDPVDNADSTQTLTFRGIYKPRYTGTPAAFQELMAVKKDTGANNLIWIKHLDGVGGGNIEISLYNSTGSLVSVNVMGVFSPTSGTEFELEFNLDITTGASRLFINGVQFGATITDTYTRSDTVDILYFGNKLGGTDTLFDVNEFVFFSTVQHTSNYTIGSTIPEIQYLETKIDLPDFAYSGAGELKSLDGASATSSVIVVEYIVNGKYHNGTAWVVSDGFLPQANTIAELNTNLSSLVVLGETSISVSVVLPQSSDDKQGFVDDFTITYTGEKNFDTGSFLTNGSFTATEINQILEKKDPLLAGEKVQHALEVNGQLKWYNVATPAWENSDGTESQTSNIIDINVDTLALLSAGSTIKLYVLLIAGTNQATSPAIDTLEALHDFGTIEGAAPAICNCFAFLTDVSGQPIIGAKVTIEINQEAFRYVEAGSRIIAAPLIVTSDSNGFVNFPLIRTSSFEGIAKDVYKMTIRVDDNFIKKNNAGTKKIIFDSPDAVSADLTSLITAA